MAVISKLTFMSLPDDIYRLVEDNLDMISLLTFGTTCVMFRDRVSQTLKRERNAIIREYWADPEMFLRMLSGTRAIITGEAALAFIMRDRSLLGDELEVCVAAGFADDLLGDFERNVFVDRAWSDNVWPTTQPLQPTPFLYQTPSGDLVRIICSHTDSPFSPMATYPTTALFNYMDEFSFGSAYRDLTLNRQGVVPGILSQSEQSRMLCITNRGEFGQSPWPAVVAVPPVPFTMLNRFAAWEDPDADEPLNPDQLENTMCLRERFQCTGQPRFFGDRGSLVDFFEPHMVDHGVMAHWSFPPYGPAAIWRMQGPMCDYYCAEGDYHLPEGIASVSILGRPLHYGPFVTGVIGKVRVGESEHRRVCNSSPSDIRRSDT